MKKMEVKMREWYEIKMRGLMGSGMKDCREICILGRTLRWTEEGLEYEADRKHREALMRGLALEDENCEQPRHQDGGDVVRRKGVGDWVRGREEV